MFLLRRAQCLTLFSPIGINKWEKVSLLTVCLVRNTRAENLTRKAHKKVNWHWLSKLTPLCPSREESILPVLKLQGAPITHLRKTLGWKKSHATQFRTLSAGVTRLRRSLNQARLLSIHTSNSAIRDYMARIILVLSVDRRDGSLNKT
jgi:hypothetical protein